MSCIFILIFWNIQAHHSSVATWLKILTFLTYASTLQIVPFFILYLLKTQEKVNQKQTICILPTGKKNLNSLIPPRNSAQAGSAQSTVPDHTQSLSPRGQKALKTQHSSGLGFVLWDACGLSYVNLLTVSCQFFYFYLAFLCQMELKCGMRTYKFW